MIYKVTDLAEGKLADLRIAVLGVTFKPNTDDMRDAPALTIVPALVGAGAELRVTDPEGRKEGEALLPGVSWHSDAYEAATDADMVLILTEWNDFRALDMARLKQTMRGNMFADLRNIYSASEARAAGFIYTSIGRSDDMAGLTGSTKTKNA